LTHFLSIKTLRTSILIAAISLISACATTPTPSSAGNVSFGEYPENYQEIVKDFLKKNATKSRSPVDLNSIEFLNEPNKFIFEPMQFSSEKFGYRACALVGKQNARQARTLSSLKAHFFLINDGKVIQHLQDSGLIALSAKFCEVQLLAQAKRLTSPAVAQQEIVDEHGFKYITCQATNKEVFFAFNPEKHQLIQQHDAKTIAQFDITELTDTFIVAESDGHRISINRASGTLLHQHGGNESQASCELTTQRKF
jgi:hypothetical protein